MNNDPLVSCLCLASNKSKLPRAVDCFVGQTYSNTELIIVYKGSDQEMLTLIAGLISSNVQSQIKLIHINSEAKMHLGELRNISIENAKGEFFCQWDDDDWFHSDRIAIQLECALTNLHPASIVTNILLFDEVNQQAYLSTFRLWENTILCKRNVVSHGITYPALDKKEDTAFVNSLIKNSRVFPVVCPYLYIYNYHGNNTWDEQHFKSMFGKSQKLSAEASAIISDVLANRTSYQKASEMLRSDLITGDLNFFHEDMVEMNKAS